MDLEPRRQAQNHLDWGSKLATLDTLVGPQFLQTLMSIWIALGVHHFVGPVYSVHANESLSFPFPHFI